jgi:hypothetical protein
MANQMTGYSISLPSRSHLLVLVDPEGRYLIEHAAKRRRRVVVPKR